MNTLKCAFGVKNGDYLGFIIYQRGIEMEKSSSNLRITGTNDSKTVINDTWI